jgi:hypothetical protein
MPWSAFRHGHIHGVPITRNPIAWIPFFAGLPVVLAVWFLLCALWVLAMPFVIIGNYFSCRSFRRKAGVFSDAGIHFPTAYNRRTIAWLDIREVVREIDYKLAHYRIVCVDDPADGEGYILSWTQDDDAFERSVAEHNIPFTIKDWRHHGGTAI